MLFGGMLHEAAQTLALHALFARLLGKRTRLAVDRGPDAVAFRVPV
jgi:hypothetical protein